LSLDLPFLLLGRYDVTEEIGRGGHAVVFRAHDNELDRDVAIKFLREDSTSAESMARFRQEVKLTAQLEHAHILHVYDTGAFEGQPFIVMELATGRTLAERLAREGPLPIADAMQIARDVGLALSHAHARNVVHRDVKPENILLGDSGAILADFGVARLTQQAMSQKITSTGTAVGTLLYMSPEQLCAEPNIDGRSDQYSLACVLYEMLTGVRPHIAATFEGLRMLRMTGAHVSAQSHRSTIPPAMDRAISKALAPLAADRFRSVLEFLVAAGLLSTGDIPVSDTAHNPTAASGSDTGPAETKRSGVRGSGRWRLPALAGALAIVMGAAYSFSTSTKAAPTDARNMRVLIRPARVSGTETSTAARLTDAISAELSGWSGIDVVDQATSGDTSVLTVQPSVQRLGDSLLVRLDVQRDRTEPITVNRFVPLNELVNPSAVLHSVVTEAVAQAVDPEWSSGAFPRVPELTGRSLQSLRAYVGAWRALRRGLLDSASALFANAAKGAKGADILPLAAFWSAQTAAWAMPPEKDYPPISPGNAAAFTRLAGNDSLLADALVALGRRRYDDACQDYRRVIERDHDSFVALYGLGECQRTNGDVRRTASGRFVFSSSHSAALAAYGDAIQAAPTSEWMSALFPSILRVTYAEGQRSRRGTRVGDSSIHYWALPSLEADTFAFVPLTKSEFETAKVPAHWEQAGRRGKATLRELATTMTHRWPDSPSAWWLQALALEMSGMVRGTDPEQSAAAAIARAARGDAPPGVHAEIAVVSARIALRQGDFRGAAAVARAAIRSTVGDARVRRQLVPLAALVSDYERAAALGLPDLTIDPRLPLEVRDSLGGFALRADFGNCEHLTEHQRALDSVFARQFNRAELRVQRETLLHRTYFGAVQCLGAGAMEDFKPDGDMEGVYRALSDGDLAKARAGLAAIQRERANSSSASITWDATFREAWALSQIADTSNAEKRIADALGNIANISPFTLNFTDQASGLRRSVELLAEFVKRGRKAPAIRKWAAHAAELGAEEYPIPSGARKR
jgi:serine/threonine protein kinase/tetratricopeptide (TPR) repeat protein